MLSLKFKFTDNIKRSTYWKFNNSLLRNKSYIPIVRKVISDVKKQYAALVYKLDEIDNIPLTEIDFQINDQLFLEVLLGKTISYSSYLKKENA